MLPSRPPAPHLQRGTERGGALQHTDDTLPLPVPDKLGRLRCVLLVVWGVSSFGLMYFAQTLQRWAGGWPVTFWLAAQGLVLLFVAVVAVYAVLANRAERVQSAIALRTETR